LQFLDGDSAGSLGLTGEETYGVRGLAAATTGRGAATVIVTTDDREFSALVRLDTEREAEYYRHGGIMRYVLRGLLAER